jgi:4-hydroxybenzoate polyprenyltransferase
MEITAVVVGVPSVWYYLTSWGLSWWSILTIAGMVALGLASGYMLYDLWVIPADKRNNTDT